MRKLLKEIWFKIQLWSSTILQLQILAYLSVQTAYSTKTCWELSFIFYWQMYQQNNFRFALEIGHMCLLYSLFVKIKELIEIFFNIKAFVWFNPYWGGHSKFKNCNEMNLVFALFLCYAWGMVSMLGYVTCNLEEIFCLREWNLIKRIQLQW